MVASCRAQRERQRLGACFEKPERGCVVLDQPQHGPNFRCAGSLSGAVAGPEPCQAPFAEQALVRGARGGGEKVAACKLALVLIIR